MFKLLLALLTGVAHAQWDLHTAYDRQAIVHLFEWKWTDIAQECENFLSKYGFAGVQVSPPSEHITQWDPFRPWWERYQPVSYKLESRSGSDDQFRDMVDRCNNVGVRIYVDAVVNHMTAASWGTGIAGSSFTENDFPEVPYSYWDFNVPQGKCPSEDKGIQDYSNIYEVRNCNLVGLRDLDTGKEYVRQKIADYLNYMIDIGVAGFRVDACKHMWPADLGAIVGKLNNLNTKYFPAGSRPFIVQEVIDQGGEPIKASEYTEYGRVTEFKYGLKLAEGIRRGNPLKYFHNFGESWGMLHDDTSLVFIDNHDNQRGHGGGGTIITHEEPRYYKMATAFMLAYPYGFPRIMSSYNFNHDGDLGPPSDGAGNTESPTFNSDGSCAGDWICEHRWRQIRNMVGFRNAAVGQPLSNWDYFSDYQIAFGRGNKAFIVINADTDSLSKSIFTGLPAGTYCNIIDGDVSSNSCTGSTITVDGSGYADFYVGTGDDPVVAIHVNAMVDGGSGGSDPVPTGYQRTVVFMKRTTSMGQDLFIRGGIDHGQRTGCTNDPTTSACAIPIFHNIGGSNSKFNAWSDGDDYLDWSEAEGGQGKYLGEKAYGTPLVWTTNNAGHSYQVDADGFGYTSLNVWGEHYWMVDVDMNCDDTEDGWFELKAYLTNGVGWENDISQVSCGGSAGGSPPYSTRNHFAKCGYVNVFHFNSNLCTINNFS